VKKYKEVLALYERALNYAQQSLEAHKHNKHDGNSKARMFYTLSCDHALLNVM